MKEYIHILIVSVLWGCTNPFLKGTSETRSNVLEEGMALVFKWQFLLPFVLNQMGSVLYASLLSSVDVSVAQPSCNALAMVFTALTASCLGERRLGVKGVLGMFLIVVGTFIALM